MHFSSNAILALVASLLSNPEFTAHDYWRADADRVRMEAPESDTIVYADNINRLSKCWIALQGVAPDDVDLSQFMAYFDSDAENQTFRFSHSMFLLNENNQDPVYMRILGEFRTYICFVTEANVARIGIPANDGNVRWLN